MQWQDYPGLFQSADHTATIREKWHFWSLKGFLVVLAAGAFLSLFPDTEKWAAITAAVLFFLGIGFSLLMAFMRFDRSWYNARAVAESVKTRTWRFMMQADPYHTEDGKARELFAEDIGCILKDNQEAIKIIPALNRLTITDEMNRVRALSLSDRKLFYKNHRVDDQLNWYIRQAAFNKRHNVGWVILMILFQIGALACVLVKLSHPEITPVPTALFTTLAGTTLSWTQAKRFGELSTSYNLTAHDISQISINYTALSEEQGFSSFVRDSEAAFSREHIQWIARRGI